MVAQRTNGNQQVGYVTVRLNIQDVSFSYSSTPVLDGISIDLHGPQLVSILGPNGVGKSTFIHCINRILTPTGGCVLIDGGDVSEMPLKEIAKTVGYVPYTSNDTFPLTVVDTVLLGRHPRASWRMTETDLEKVREVLVKLGIDDLAMRYFNELSAGQHQKVMLARGLVQEPRVLMLDEPTSNLDVKHQLGISRLLRRLSRDEGLMVVMISHDLNIAAKYSDNVILMHEGRIFAVGPPGDVITTENIRTVYGVDSCVIEDEGRPHVILRDPDNLSCPPLDTDHGCSVPSDGRGGEVERFQRRLPEVRLQEVRVHRRMRDRIPGCGGPDVHHRHP